jgi:hypothetical protein
VLVSPLSTSSLSHPSHTPLTPLNKVRDFTFVPALYHVHPTLCHALAAQRSTLSAEQEQCAWHLWRLLLEMPEYDHAAAAAVLRYTHHFSPMPHLTRTTLAHNVTHRIPLHSTPSHQHPTHSPHAIHCVFPFPKHGHCVRHVATVLSCRAVTVPQHPHA